MVQLGLCVTVGFVAVRVSDMKCVFCLRRPRFLTPEELDSLIEYLRVKRERIVRADPLAGKAFSTLPSSWA